MTFKQHGLLHYMESYSQARGVVFSTGGSLNQSYFIVLAFWILGRVKLQKATRITLPPTASGIASIYCANVMGTI